MMKVFGKMQSEARLEKNWCLSVNERAIYYKILHFGEIWKIPCVVHIFHMCFPCLKKVTTKFLVFPLPCPPCPCDTDGPNVRRDLFYLLDYVTPSEIFQIGNRKKKKKKKKKDMVK